MKSKHDMKKLALLGLMGGLLMTTNANANEKEEGSLKEDTGSYLAFAGCSHGGGNGGGNGGGGSCSNRSTYPTSSCSTQSTYPQSSCSHGSNYPTSSCSNRSTYPQSSCAGRGQSPTANRDNFTADETPISNATTKQYSESDLLSSSSPLNSDSKAVFQGFDAEGKKLALKLVNQSCKGQNECKGLNSCKTAENSCKGTSGCKGKTPGPFKDKNDAIQVTAKKMAEKRGALRS